MLPLVIYNFTPMVTGQVVDLQLYLVVDRLC